MTPQSYRPVNVLGDAPLSVVRQEIDLSRSGWQAHTQPNASGATPLALRDSASVSINCPGSVRVTG